MRYNVSLGGKTYRLELERIGDQWQCRLDGRDKPIQVTSISGDKLSILLEGRSFEVKHEPTADGAAVFIRGMRYEVRVEDPRSWRGRAQAAKDESGPQTIVASMPGKVVRILAQEGDAVLSGQGIAVVEAMKMQNEIRSPRAGVLKKLLAHEGMKVSAGEALGVVE
jgi:biotin carboxyl carrier protein